MSLLEVRELAAAYGAAQVLHGVTFDVRAGEVATLIGRNGMGKTTTVSTIMGLVQATGGSVRFDGRDLSGAAPHVIGRAGIGLVPEGRHVFPTLSVIENLVATARAGADGQTRWTLDRVLDLFPRLAERAGHTGAQLSGGEQQMVAIARALMTNPKLLILDEATEGLAPLIRKEIWETLARLKRDGEAILVIDKHIAALTAIADRHTILEKGAVVWQGTSADLLRDQSAIDRYLHL
ncbi:MAG: ABC transporter ATP-binding protein [Pseudomonadota bacterium]